MKCGSSILVSLALLGTLLVPPAFAQDTAADSVMRSIDADAASIASSVLDRLDHAWNEADGAAFAEQFAERPEVINIFGQRYRSREELAERIQFIFDGIFKGSRHQGRVIEVARYLAPDRILVVSAANLSVPTGRFSPATQNRQSFILANVNGAWKIEHWHNTTVVSTA